MGQGAQSQRGPRRGFLYYLRDKYSFTHNEITNIYKAIYELYALPNINIINEKAADIYNKFTTVQNYLN